MSFALWAPKLLQGFDSVLFIIYPILSIPRTSNTEQWSMVRKMQYVDSRMHVGNVARKDTVDARHVAWRGYVERINKFTTKRFAYELMKPFVGTEVDVVVRARVLWTLCRSCGHVVGIYSHLHDGSLMWRLRRYHAASWHDIRLYLAVSYRPSSPVAQSWDRVTYLLRMSLNSRFKSLEPRFVLFTYSITYVVRVFRLQTDYLFSRYRDPWIKVVHPLFLNRLLEKDAQKCNASAQHVLVGTYFLLQMNRDLRILSHDICRHTCGDVWHSMIRYAVSKIVIEWLTIT